MKHTPTQRHREQLVVAKGWGRGMDWGFGVGKYEPLHLECINKVIVYRELYPVINHNGKKYKERIHICV